MSGTPGDYGVGFSTFLGKVSDPAVKKSKLNAELANGRLAMMAIIGMFFQDGVVLSVLHVLCMFFACSLHVLCVFQVSCDLIVIVLSAFPVNLQRFWTFKIGFNPLNHFGACWNMLEAYCTVAEQMCCRML